MGFVAFPHQSLRVQLPTWLPSKAWGGGGRSRRVLPKTSPIWGSKSELEEVRVRLPVRQGEGNRRNGDPESHGTQLWLSQQVQTQGRKDGAEPLTAGRGQDSLDPLVLPCGALVGHVQGFLAAQFATFLVGRSPARASSASTQSQGHPNGHPCLGRAAARPWLPSESLGKDLLLPFPLPTDKHTQTPFSFPWVCCGHLRKMSGDERSWEGLGRMGTDRDQGSASLLG